MKNFLFILLSIVTLTAHSSESLQLLTENSPPYNHVQDGKLVGPAVEIIKELQKRVGHEGTIEVLPWNRAYKKTLTTKNTALFLTARTPAREKLFKWIGPIISDQWGFLAQKTFKKKIKDLESAKETLRIGSYLGDVKDEFLKANGFKNLDTSLNNQVNARKLASGRLDLWVVSLVEFKTHLKNEGLNPNDFKIVYKFEKVDLYLAFSLKTDDAIVSRWKNAFDSLLKDGTYYKYFPKQAQDE